MKRETHEVVAQADEIFELAKKIKAWRNRYQTKREKVEEARDEVTKLKTELLEIAEAMVRGEDTKDLRDPGQIHRDIARAETKLAKTLERNANDIQEMDFLCSELADYLVSHEIEDKQDEALTEEGAPEIQDSQGEEYFSGTFPIAQDFPQVDPMSDSEVTEEADDSDFTFESGDKL